MSATPTLSAYLPASNDAADRFDNGEGSDRASFAASVYAAMASKTPSQQLIPRFEKMLYLGPRDPSDRGNSRAHVLRPLMF